mmetsp:Transcript_19833/g.64490  ORF Transcript_19833/g.64490 Transcript_19833/m.64490 type:complete len:380 (+) Transcript_19833:914-2053(+)
MLRDGRPAAARGCGGGHVSREVCGRVAAGDGSLLLLLLARHLRVEGPVEEVVVVGARVARRHCHVRDERRVPHKPDKADCDGERVALAPLRRCVLQEPKRLLRVERAADDHDEQTRERERREVRAEDEPRDADRDKLGRVAHDVKGGGTDAVADDVGGVPEEQSEHARRPHEHAPRGVHARKRRRGCVALKHEHERREHERPDEVEVKRLFPSPHAFVLVEGVLDVQHRNAHRAPIQRAPHVPRLVVVQVVVDVDESAGEEHHERGELVGGEAPLEKEAVPRSHAHECRDPEDDGRLRVDVVERLHVEGERQRPHQPREPPTRQRRQLELHVPEGVPDQQQHARRHHLQQSQRVRHGQAPQRQLVEVEHARAESEVRHA